MVTEKLSLFDDLDENKDELNNLMSDIIARYSLLEQIMKPILPNVKMNLVLQRISASVTELIASRIVLLAESGISPLICQIICEILHKLSSLQDRYYKLIMESYNCGCCPSGHKYKRTKRVKPEFF